MILANNYYQRYPKQQILDAMYQSISGSINRLSESSSRCKPILSKWNRINPFHHLSEFKRIGKPYPPAWLVRSCCLSSPFWVQWIIFLQNPNQKRNRACTQRELSALKAKIWARTCFEKKVYSRRKRRWKLLLALKFLLLPPRKAWIMLTSGKPGRSKSCNGNSCWGNGTGSLYVDW